MPPRRVSSFRRRTKKDEDPEVAEEEEEEPNTTEDGGAAEEEEEYFDDEEENFEEEEEEGGDDTESDSAEGGSESDDEYGPDPVHVTVQLAGSDSCKILHFRNEVVLPEFRAEIAKACGLEPKSKFIIARKRKTKPPQQIINKSHFDYMIDSYFNQEDQFLRVLVTPAGGGGDSASSTLAATGTAAAAAAVAASATINNSNNAAASPAASLTPNQHQHQSVVLGSSIALPPVTVPSPSSSSSGMMEGTTSGGGIAGVASASSGDFNASHSMMSSQRRPSSSYSRMESSETDALKAAFESGQEVQWTEMKLLGTGAFGKVVEAITNSGHIVAVKHMVFPAQPNADNNGGKGTNEAETMVEEIRLMKNLRHRNIVGYYGCQMKVLNDGGRVVDVFMEACHGGSLNSLRKKLDRVNGRLPVVLVRSYMRQVLEGLSYLHLKEVVHRDIKGDNVLISSSGVAKLADFGCSKKLGAHSFEDTLMLESRTGSDTAPAARPVAPGGEMCKTLVGTPLFIAPEVLTESGGGYLHSADIWSIGCLVIELFGRKPWNLQNTSVFSVMFAIAQSKTLPTGMPDEADPNLTSFLTECFNRDPALRPTARQLLDHRWMTCPDSELVEPKWKE